jgi:hypothetical protein
MADKGKGDTSLSQRTTVPDFAYIRREVPIKEVARELGLFITGNMVRCWRPEQHEHGDRTPSVGLHKRNNRAKCFVCDSRSLSPIDLVMSVRGVNRQDAVTWLVARYDVPGIPKGKHIGQQQRWNERYRIGTGTSRFELLVNCGIWADLTASERSMLVVLDTYAVDDCVEISYRGIARLSGVRSFTTISRALKRFCNLHILARVERESRDGLRACNCYRWTTDDEQFLRMAEDSYNRFRTEIQIERDLQRAAREKRKAERGYIPVKTLYTGCSKTEKPWPTIVERENGEWLESR